MNDRRTPDTANINYATECPALFLEWADRDDVYVTHQDRLQPLREFLSSANDAAFAASTTVHLTTASGQNFGLGIAASNASDAASVGALRGDPSFILKHEDERRVLVWLLDEQVAPQSEDYRLLDKIALRVTGFALLDQTFPLPGFGGWAYCDEEFDRPAIEDNVAKRFPLSEALEAMCDYSNATVYGDLFPVGTLSQVVTLASGRSRSDKAWPNVSMPLHLLVGRLSDHQIGKKDGQAIVMGETINKVRSKKSIKAMHMVGLDVDNGTKIEAALASIQKLNRAAILYTTHSHMKSTTAIPEDQLDAYARRKSMLTLTSDGILSTAEHYLRAEKKYLPYILANLTYTGKTQTEAGMQYVFQHEPIPKFRVMYPLSEAFAFDAQGCSHREALTLWEDTNKKLAAVLGLEIDLTGISADHMFYLPRHAEGAPYEVHVIRGPLLSVTELDFAVPIENVFASAAKDLGGSDHDRASGTRLTKSGLDMYGWVTRNKHRFEIADAVRDYCHDDIRIDSEGRVTIACPFDHLHSNSGDLSDVGFFVCNASDAAEGSFVAHCRHTSCRDRSKADFLCELINTGALPEECLSDTRYMPETVDQDDESKSSAETVDDTLQRLRADVEAFSDETPDSALDKALETLAALNISKTQRSAIAKVICEKTKLASKEIEQRLSSALKEAAIARRHADRRSSNKASTGDERARPILNPTVDGFAYCVGVAQDRFARLNAKRPTWFNMGNKKVRLMKEEDLGQITPQVMSVPQMCAELNVHIDWEKPTRKGSVSVSAPNDIASHILHTLNFNFPRLETIVRAPFFAADGTLIDQPGYHAPSGIYFNPPPGFVLPPIPDSPSDEQIRGARALIEENVFPDFPFNDGPDRGGMSSKAHAWALLLQPMMRSMILGKTPVYLISKPEAGTGASLLVQVLVRIATGSDPETQTEKTSNDEQRKAITAFLLTGAQHFFLDNINAFVAGSAYAGAVTSDIWSDRRLGLSETVTVPIRVTWIFAGNNVDMSGEMARRCLPIPLDAERNPKTREKFVHDNLPVWVDENRPQLVAACLTLIRAWVSRGRQEWQGKALASFEGYCRAMGGVLETIGVEGFLGNLDITASMSSSEEIAWNAFMSLWWESFGSEPRRIGNKDGSSQGSEFDGDRSLVHLIEANEVDIFLKGFDGEQKRNALGTLLDRRRKRVFPIGEREVRLMGERRAGNKQYWWLEPVKSLDAIG